MNNLEFNSADREILRMLYSTAASVDVYVFYERYNLLPSDILRSIRRFEVEGVIRLETNATLTLTEHGRRWVVGYRKHIFLKKVEAEWKEPPASYLIYTLPAFSPYIPKRRNISKKFFESLASGD